MNPSWLLVLDLAGIAVFASTGALVAVRLQLDIFGALVLGMVTGLGGGVVRDLLIGAVPPAALVDWRYLAVPAAVSVLAFWFHPTMGRLERQVLRLDAVGLGIFCVAGAVKAHEAGLDVLPAALLGLVTAVGGGIMRDVLAARVPAIFGGELYATPAFAGALLAAVGHEVGWDPAWYVAPAVLAIVWRLLALRRGWTAPLPPGPRN